ncbi:hypothetical protein FKM82_007300 [Ascaphus truei]
MAILIILVYYTTFLHKTVAFVLKNSTQHAKLYINHVTEDPAKHDTIANEHISNVVLMHLKLSQVQNISTGTLAIMEREKNGFKKSTTLLLHQEWLVWP